MKEENTLEEILATIADIILDYIDKNRGTNGHSMCNES